MKLKDIILTEDELEPKIHRNYNDYIESDIPENSIELDSSGRIVSNKTKLLSFINFLLSEVEYCPESSNNNKFNDKEKPKKKKSMKKSKDVPYSKLPLKDRIKRIKGMNHGLNGKSNYPA